MWGYDEVAGLICMTDEFRRANPPEQFFEGEYATTKTYIDWLNPPDKFKRKPHPRN